MYYLPFVRQSIHKSHNCKHNSYWIHTHDGHDHESDGHIHDSPAIRRRTVRRWTDAAAFCYRKFSPHRLHWSSGPLLGGCVWRWTIFYFDWKTWFITATFHRRHTVASTVLSDRKRHSALKLFMYNDRDVICVMQCSGSRRSWITTLPLLPGVHPYPHTYPTMNFWLPPKPYKGVLGRSSTSLKDVIYHSYLPLQTYFVTLARQVV